VKWTAVDDSFGDATSRDGQTVVTLRFGFGEDGLTESEHADERGRTVAAR
jgi:hypothetical protein